VHERVCLRRFVAWDQHQHAVTIYKGAMLRNCCRWPGERKGALWTFCIGTGLLFCDARVFEVATEERPVPPDSSASH
jgi:hypothetical protein